MTQATPPTISREDRNPSIGAVARVAVPLLILAAALYTYIAAASYWTRFYGMSLAFAFMAYVAVIARGRLRDGAVIMSSVLLGIAAIEGYFVLHYRTSIDTNTRGYSVNMAVLGWGPAHPGVYHHHKVDAKTGRVILDADYTIDEHLTRKVESAANAPTIAIGGGSTIFGSGLPDSETLPQAVADDVGRRLHVVNLAFSGYGAGQFLRILETGLHDDILIKNRAFALAASPALVDQAECTRPYTLHGPSYEVVEGRVTFMGTCSQQWSLPLRGLFEITSLYDIVVARLDDRTPRQKLELYIAMLNRIGQLAREKYEVPTALIYSPGPTFAQSAGTTDAEIIERLRAAGLIVVDGGLDPAEFPGQDLTIPGDGHPTGVANRELAARLVKALSKVVSLDP